MSDVNMTYGNLALSLPQRSSSFEVIDGGIASATENCTFHSISLKPSFVSRHFGAIFFFSLIFVLAMYLGVSFVASDSAFVDALDSSDRVEQVVHSGDTLWQIASEHPISGLDTDQTIQVIRSWNNLDSSSLSVGDTIYVPSR